MEVSDLFTKGEFEIHSGRITNWSIDCSALNEGDWDCIAQLIAERYSNYERVIGISFFGKILAEHLEKHLTTGGLLIVDDVYDPVKMKKARVFWRTRQSYVKHDIQGFTIFSCLPLAGWVRSLWNLDVRVDKWDGPNLYSVGK